MAIPDRPGRPGDSDAALQQSWRDNAASWTAAVRGHAIESRRVATDAAILGAALNLRPQHILDLGCGEGWLTRASAGRGLNAVGVTLRGRTEPRHPEDGRKLSLLMEATPIA